MGQKNANQSGATSPPIMVSTPGPSVSFADVHAAAGKLLLALHFAHIGDRLQNDQKTEDERDPSMDAQTAHLVEKGDRVHVRQECAGHSDAEQEICAAREGRCDIGRNGSCYVRRLIRRQTLTVYDRLHDPAHGDVGKAVLHADDETQGKSEARPFPRSPPCGAPIPQRL